jgi:hypothetical protein
MPAPVPPGDGDGDPDTVAIVPTTAGVRNFEQVNATMMAVTGVEGNSAVISRFNTLKSQLPTDNDIKAFSFSNQIAVTVLAAEYCNALVTNTNNVYTTQRTAAVGAINFGANPSVALNAAGKADVAQKLLAKFWGAGLAASPNAATTQASIVTLLGDLVAGETDNTTTTRKAVTGACTAVLSSSPILIL